MLLHFKSAKLIAKALEARHGRVRAGSTNLGDPSRVYVRKAQYDWRYVQLSSIWRVPIIDSTHRWDWVWLYNHVDRLPLAEVV